MIWFSFRVVLGAALTCAGGFKIAFASDLVEVLASIVPFAPKSLLKAAGVILPPVEVVVGVLWILPWDEPSVSVAGCTLFGIFVLSTIVLASRRPRGSCNCFGDFMVLSPRKAFLRSLVLFLFALCSASSPRLVVARHGQMVFSYLTALSIVTITLLTVHAQKLRQARTEADSSMG